MAYRFKHLEKVVGVFLTLVILIIVVVVIFIGRERRWFEQQYEFTTEFWSGEGLKPGIVVTIKGIQIGEVKSVFLNEDNWIEVRFAVYEEYAERIRKDSVAKLNSPLIGSKVMEIIPGGVHQLPLENGSYIWSQDTEIGADILKERAKEERPDQLTRILGNVERLTYNLSDAEGNLERTLVKVQDLFELLSAEDGSLNRTLKTLDRLTSSIQEQEGSIGKLLYDNYELYNNITSIMKRINAIMADIQTLSGTISETSPEIKAAIERANVTMDEAIGLIRTLQENFFVRGFSSRKEDVVVPLENAEREGGYSP
ncbi:MAG: MCE family protein [Spirochaetota bacterium]|nr:MAG: MCE family protein [Spirochaetota bacterium]